jgi:Domain of unknown function (DUF4105)
VSRGITSSLLAGALLMAPAVAQGAVQTPEPGSELRVYLMTMGPGERVWERFGHNAIWIRDPASQPDTAYNYGLFDFRQQNFLLRFIRGQMWYWMAGFPTESYVRTYVRDNRSVWVQELNLPPAARLELREFLRWNEKPEHRFYHYDYYRDNCSTRVRDALDRVLGGAIKAQTGGLPTGTTYRFHTQRLTANDPPIFTGLLLALGPGVDRPISAWEEMFLPMALREHARRVVLRGRGGSTVPLVASERTLFESTAPQPPAAPPSWLPWYLALGAVVGGLAGLLGAAAGDPQRRWARAGLGLFSILWGLVGGLGGVVLAVLWALTDHVMAYRNENLFQLNPLLLGLPVLVPLGLAGVHRAARWARLLASVLAGVSLAGFVLQALPGLDQVNGPVIALMLPIHLGVAAGLLRAIRPEPAPVRPTPPGIRGTR